MTLDEATIDQLIAELMKRADHVVVAAMVPDDADCCVPRHWMLGNPVVISGLVTMLHTRADMTLREQMRKR